MYEQIDITCIPYAVGTYLMTARNLLRFVLVLFGSNLIS